MFYLMSRNLSLEFSIQGLMVFILFYAHLNAENV